MIDAHNKKVNDV